MAVAPALPAEEQFLAGQEDEVQRIFREYDDKEKEGWLNPRVRSMTKARIAKTIAESSNISLAKAHMVLNAIKDIAIAELLMYDVFQFPNVFVIRRRLIERFVAGGRYFPKVKVVARVRKEVAKQWGTGARAGVGYFSTPKEAAAKKAAAKEATAKEAAAKKAAAKKAAAKKKADS